jgi:conjugal transfer pilus assembly protein TraV
MLGKLLFIPFALGLAGCNMTGIGGTDKFDCQAPVGIPCESLSGAYANAVADNLPGSKKKTKSKYASNKTKAAPGVVGEAPQTGAPLLSDRTVLRVWVAPWEDGKKVLHDQAYLYAVVDPGHWQIAHTNQKIAAQYRAVKAPVAARAQQQPETPSAALPGFLVPQPSPQPQGTN